MDNFRVISPNHLQLSREQCLNYLTRDEDPMLSASSNSKNGCDISFDRGDGWSLTELKFCQGGVPPTSASIAPGADSLVAQLRNDDPIIQRWLLDNFEMAEGQSIARGDMYRLFCDLCQRTGLIPCNQALFGKTVRNTFPQIKTRRIGVRKNSRYHYTGISPKLTSNISEELLLIKKNGAIRTTVAHDPATDYPGIGALLDPNMGPDHLITTLLPDFPTAHTVTVADEIDVEVTLLLSLYRYLALDILTAVIKTHFIKLQEITSVFWKNVPNSIYSHLTEESLMGVIITCDRQIYAAMLALLVPNILLQEITSVFWKNVPNSIYSHLTEESVMGVIITCDRQIYAAMLALLIPNILVRIPNSMMELLLKNFGRQYQQMMEKSLQACPHALRCKKMQETRCFCKRLSHRLSVCKLCGQVQEILVSDSKVAELRRHVGKIDVAHIAISSEFAVHEKSVLGFKKRIQSGLEQFRQLLRHHSPLESYTRWIQLLFYQNLQVDGCGRGDDYAGTARVVYLELSYIVALLGREMSAGKASPNAQITYHMLEMFFISYLRYLLETEFKEETIQHYSKLPAIS